MAASAHVRWLHEQLPALVAAGVLTPDAAERLRAHYAGTARDAAPRLVMVLFGVLGALFVGGGVILLLAHNWDALSRPARTALSLLPLGLCLLLAAWVLARDLGAGWREAAGASWTLAIGSSIALVGQTYHLPGDWPTFLRTWLLLAVPVLYLLRSVTAALLYCLGLFAWAVGGQGEALMFWPLLLLALPFFAWRLGLVGRRGEASAAGDELLAWAFAVTVAASLLPTLEELAAATWAPLLVALFAGYLAAAMLVAPRRWERPFRVLGGLGFVTTSLVLTFADAWRELGDLADVTPDRGVAAEATVAALVTLAAVALLSLAWARHGHEVLPLAAALPLALGGCLLATAGYQEVAAALLNLYLLGLGAWWLVDGMRDDSLRRANVGTAVVGLIILLRFFDTEWGFLVRGSAFIAVGLAFLLVNSLLLRRRRAVTA